MNYGMFSGICNGIVTISVYYGTGNNISLAIAATAFTAMVAIGIVAIIKVIKKE